MTAPATATIERPGVFGTRIGRRLLALLLGCALLPLTAFAWLTLTQVSSQLQASQERTLHNSAKMAGMELASRVLAIVEELGILADLHGNDPQGLGRIGKALRERLQRQFLGVQFVDGAGAHAEFGAPLALGEITAAETRHLATGRCLARMHTGPDGRAHVVLIRRLRPGEALPLLVAAIRPESLLDIEALRGSGNEVVVTTADLTLLATSLHAPPDLEPMRASVGARPAAGDFEWQLRGEPHTARYWRVFLQPQVGMDWIVVQSRPSSINEARRAAFEQSFLMTAGLTLLLVVITSMVQIRRTLVPIRGLLQATRAVASGNLDARANLVGADELSELGRSFDDMTRELVENIRRRELTEIDLVAARDAALAAVRAKAEFLTNVSHELRTPLTSVLGSAEILAQYGGDDPDVRAEFLGIVVDQAHRLRNLIEGVLELNNDDDEAFAPVDVADTLRQAVQAMPESARARIQLAVEDGLPAVFGVSHRLVGLWRHLLDNAVKFSPPATPIDVRARARAGQLSIDVVDRGPGIAADALERIFEPFTQIASNMDTAKAQGIGLGLTLSRNVAERHGGRIEVVSTPGKGSTFRVWLPAIADVPVAAAAT